MKTFTGDAVGTVLTTLCTDLKRKANTANLGAAEAAVEYVKEEDELKKQEARGRLAEAYIWRQAVAMVEQAAEKLMKLGVGNE